MSIPKKNHKTVTKVSSICESVVRDRTIRLIRVVEKSVLFLRSFVEQPLIVAIVICTIQGEGNFAPNRSYRKGDIRLRIARLGHVVELLT
jgi:hypothetical protein